MESEYLHILKSYFGDSYVFIEKLICSQDEHTRIHSENVAAYAILFGKTLNLNNKDLELIKIGSLLHDIGKIGIPNYILNKNDVLTKAEYEIIKKHPLIGEALLPNNCHEEIKKIVRSHHERIDGHGYPDGIEGNDISYLSRMVTIADAFDAMMTKRPYNSEKTLEEALKELYKFSRPQLNRFGKTVQQFDSCLVDVFIQVINKDHCLLKKEDARFVNNEKVLQMKKIEKKK